MTWASLSITRDVDDHGMVRRPRATDAIGGALNAAFGQAGSLPHDMARLLDLLDQRSRRHH